MKIDAHIEYRTLAEVPTLAREAERLGFDGVWFPETTHDPFLGAALAAEHTARISIGTNVALAFTRSPTLLAYLAWDLAALSGGRFILGLGSQVKAHIVRRFGMPWEPAAPRLREIIRAIRTVWQTWRTNGSLDFRGRWYSLTLMTPFFTPPRHDYPIPVVTAGVNPVMCSIAGSAADGFQVHPLHTPDYLKTVVLPAVRAAQSRAGRSDVHLEINASVFIVTGTSVDDLEQMRRRVKRSIAFYASTPSYRAVLAHHGWQEVGDRLSRLARSGEWDRMGDEIPDEMLTSIAVVAPLDEVGARLRARYDGLADRVGPYEPFSPDAADRWRRILAGFRGSADT